jgi:hypothetical protein
MANSPSYIEESTVAEGTPSVVVTSKIGCK